MDSTPLVYFIIPGIQDDINKITYNDINTVLLKYLNIFDKWMIRRTCKEARRYYKVGKQFIPTGEEEFIMYGLDDIFQCAIEIDSVEMLKYYYDEIPYKDDASYCNFASFYGRLSCLKYLHEKGCKFNTYTCPIAAEKGNIECLRYLHENGCEWDSKTVKASFNFMMKVYKELDYKDDHLSFFTDYTIIKKYSMCAIYSIENGCPGGEKWMKWYNAVKQYLSKKPCEENKIRKTMI